MQIKSTRERLLGSSVFIAAAIAIAAPSVTALGLMALPGQALAQAAADTAPVPEVIVTGSSIKRVNYETASPIDVITSLQLEKSGFDTISSVLTNITANGAGTLSSNNSEAFAGGASGVALRGLSVGATLVLVDGHRLAPYPLSDDGERQFVDVGSIPFNAVERIEVLKDGASAVYGSDAIAGVVNVILKKQITGFDATVDGGTSQHGGGETTHLAASWGTGDLSLDGHNFYITGEYRKQDAVYLRDRTYEPWGNLDFSRIGGNNLLPGAQNLFNAGFPATLTPYLVTNAATNSTTFLGSGCNSTALNASQCTYTSPQTVLSPSTKASVLVGYTAHFGQGWEAKLRLSLFDSQGQQTNSLAIAPNSSYPGASYGGEDSNPVGGPVVPAIGAIANYTVPANYLGSASPAGSYLEGVIPQLGLPTINIDSKTYRAGLDVTGKVRGWDVTGSLGFSEVVTHENFSNYVNYDTLYTDLTTFNSSGSPIFNPLGGNSPSVLSAIAPGFGVTATDQLYYAEVDATKTVLPLPGGDLALAVGASVVSKSLRNPGPLAAEEGLVGGIFNTYAFGDQTDVAEYAELEAKLFKTLELSAALRDDWYDTYGNSLTPKFGVKWRPTNYLALRGTFSNGFRAPSPAEVGQASTVFGLSGIADPILCPNGSSGPFAVGEVQAACSASPGFVQTTTKTLKPETSTSFTGGAVLEPIRGWSTTVDYYHIEIDHQIISESELPTYQFNSSTCLRGPALPIAGVVTSVDGSGNVLTTGTAVPLAGPLDACFAGYVNAQSTETSGTDIQSQYKHRFGDGVLTLSIEWTHVIDYNLTGPSGTTYHLVGTHGPSGVSGDTGNPSDRINAAIGWDDGPLSLGLSAYWISSYSVEDPSANGQATCAGAWNGAAALAYTTPSSINQQYCHVAQFTSVNMTSSYKLDKHITLAFSIDNLFDASAPLDPQTYGGSYTPVNPSLHEDGVIGRFFRIGATFKY